MKRAVVILICARMMAQTGRQTDIAQEIADKAMAEVSSMAGAVRPDVLTGASAIDGLISAWLLDQRGKDEELLNWMEQRTDLQMGAHPLTGAGSSAALKAGAPQVLSVAVDMGMLSRTTNGQFITFRGTPAGMAETMLGWKVLHRPWDRLTGAVTFDTNRGATPGVLKASGEQLAAWSVGLQVWNGRGPRAADWLKLAQAGGAYVRAREALGMAMAQWTELRDWQEDFAARLEREVDRPLDRGWITRKDAEKLVWRIALDEMERLSRLSVAPGVTQALDGYTRELRGQLQARTTLREAPRRGPIVALDWTVLRNQGERAAWAATAIAQTNLGSAGRVDLTSNWTVRSKGAAQAALELAVPSRAGIASLSTRAGRAAWNRGPFDFSAQATWTIVLSGGLRVPVSIGLTRAAEGNAVSKRVTIGIQYTADPLKRGN